MKSLKIINSGAYSLALWSSRRGAMELSQFSVLLMLLLLLQGHGARELVEVHLDCWL